MMWTSTTYTTCCGLIQKYPWLEGKDDALMELLTFCPTPEARELVIDLISRIDYLEHKRFVDSVSQLSEYIIKEWIEDPSKTQIVAATFDADPDSAQYVLYLLKPILAKKKIEGIRLVNNVNQSVKNIAKYPHVIFIDEFIGSGITAHKRCKVYSDEYERVLKSKKKDVVPSVKFCCITGMAQGLNHIDSKGFIAYAHNVLRKGISEYFEASEREAALDIMHEMESMLDQNEKFEALGWGGAEALYYAEDLNIPNSVFPIFWWNKLKNGEERNTLFTRAEQC